MTNRQKILMEDEINSIQQKIDEALRHMEADNYFGLHETAQRWSDRVDEEVTRMNGIKIALSVLGYRIDWKDNRRVIVSAGA